MLDAYIYDGIRTPIGCHAGVLSSIRPDDLLAENIKHLLQRTNVDISRIEDVVIGCTNQAGEDAPETLPDMALCLLDYLLVSQDKHKIVYVVAGCPLSLKHLELSLVRKGSYLLLVVLKV